MKKIVIISRIFGGIGDFVSMTSLIKKIKEKFPNIKIILITGNQEIFKNNKNIYKIYFLKNRYLKSLCLRILYVLEKLFPSIFLNYIYKKNKIYKNLEEEVRKGSKENYQKLLSKHWKIDIDYNNLQNEIFFSEEEIREYDKKYSDLPEKFYLIHSEGKISYTPNKEIGYENFQRIINENLDKNWIQIGEKKDKKLTNVVIDLRGKTSIRELFYIISKSEVVICQEGAYNHIANAVKTLSVTISTGFNTKEIYSYYNTVSIQNKDLPECSPCMMIEKCPYNMRCINDEVIFLAINYIKGL